MHGKVYGALTGEFRGSLTDVSYGGRQITGLLSGVGGRLAGVGGRFGGSLDRSTGRLEGVVRAATGCCDGETSFGFEGCLRPFRRINVTQMIGGDPIGGVTLQVQVPPPHAGCLFEVPPATTLVEAFTDEPE